MKFIFTLLLSGWVWNAVAQHQPFFYTENAPGNQRYIDISVVDSVLILLGSNEKGLEIIEARKNGEPISRYYTSLTDTSLNPFQLLKNTQQELLVVAEKKSMWWTEALVYKLESNLTLTPFAQLSNDTIAHSLNYCLQHNENYYCAGIYSTPSMTFGNDFLVTKINANGDLVWSKNFGEPNRNEVAASLQVVGDRIYVFGDKNLPSFEYNPYHITLDTNGNFISETPLDWLYNSGVKASCMTDDAIYITGESATATSSWFDIYLEKWDLQGNRRWRKLIPKTEESETGFDIKYHNGQLWITGYAHNPTLLSTDMHYTVLDTSGAIIHTKLYHLGDVDIGYRIAFGDGGIYAVGSGTGDGTDYIMAYDTSALILTQQQEFTFPQKAFSVERDGGKISLRLHTGVKGGQFDVYTADGKQFTSLKAKSRETNFYIPEKGIYFIRYYNGRTTQTEKIILN